MIFDDIVGQYNVIRSIKGTIANNRTAHAYLFCGPDGVGKSIAASIFASVLNCRERGVDPCGICPSCLKAENGNHPDIIHVKTQKASISVDDIRELQGSMQKKPYENGVKVYIIHDSEKMTEQAQNGLLKTLEEPPAHVIIILLTNNRYSLLNTIISRCQVLNFYRAPEKAIESYLKDKMGMLQKDARYIATFSDGILKKALEFLNDEAVKKDRKEILGLAEELYKRDKIYVLSKVDYFLSNKDKIDYILEIMMSWFRDILIYKECKNKEYLINLDMEDIIINECPKFTYKSLDNIISSIKQTAQNINSNVNFQLSIETMLLKIQEG